MILICSKLIDCRCLDCECWIFFFFSHSYFSRLFHFSKFPQPYHNLLLGLNIAVFNWSHFYPKHQNGFSKLCHTIPFLLIQQFFDHHNYSISFVFCYILKITPFVSFLNKLILSFLHCFIFQCLLSFWK